MLRTRIPMRPEISHAMPAAPSSATPSARSVAFTIGLQLLPDVGERQRHAHERDRRMMHRHRDVQHVDLQRVAVAPRAAEAARPRLDDLRPRGVIFHRRQAGERLRRIADDDAVRPDEGDARAEQRPMRPASSCSCGTVVNGALRARSSAVSVASATSVFSIWRSVRSRIDRANSTPATTSAMIAAENAARKSFARKETVISRQSAASGDRRSL